MTDQSRRSARVGPQPANEDRTIEELRARPRGGEEEAGSGVRPENIVWIFGSGRSGSTWLSSTMGDVEGHALWDEPGMGYLFGYFYYFWVDKRKHETPQFIMGREREVWLGSIRNFVLDGARAIFSGLSRDGFLIVKEPSGSVGAPLMMEALPESRMILLTRDTRDHEENKDLNQPDGRRVLANEDPVAFAQGRAAEYLEAKAKEAYEAHKGRKVLVRYEDLRSDALGTMKRVYATLGIPVSEEELVRAVERHARENPFEEKKEGR